MMPPPTVSDPLAPISFVPPKLRIRRDSPSKNTIRTTSRVQNFLPYLQVTLPTKRESPIPSPRLMKPVLGLPRQPRSVSLRLPPRFRSRQTSRSADRWEAFEWGISTMTIGALRRHTLGETRFRGFKIGTPFAPDSSPIENFYKASAANP